MSKFVVLVFPNLPTHPNEVADRQRQTQSFCSVLHDKPCGYTVIKTVFDLHRSFTENQTDTVFLINCHGTDVGAVPLSDGSFLDGARFATHLRDANLQNCLVIACQCDARAFCEAAGLHYVMPVPLLNKDGKSNNRVCGDTFIHLQMQWLVPMLREAGPEVKDTPLAIALEASLCASTPGQFQEQEQAEQTETSDNTKWIIIGIGILMLLLFSMVVVTHIRKNSSN